MWKAFVHYAQQQQQQQQPSSISLQQSTRNLQALENRREQHFAHANIRTQELARSTLLFAICFCEHYYRGRLEIQWKFYLKYLRARGRRNVILSRVVVVAERQGDLYSSIRVVA
jgi:hypothetical protein